MALGQYLVTVYTDPTIAISRGVATFLKTRDIGALLKVIFAGGPTAGSVVDAWLVKNDLSVAEIDRRVQAYQANLKRLKAESDQRLAEFRNQRPLPPPTEPIRPLRGLDIRRAVMHLEEVEIRALCYRLLAYFDEKETKHHQQIAKYVEAAAPNLEDLYQLANYAAIWIDGAYAQIVPTWLAANGLSAAEIDRRAQAYQANLRLRADESAQRWAEIRRQQAPQPQPSATSGSLFLDTLDVLPRLPEAEVQAMCYYVLSRHSDKESQCHRALVRYVNATPETRHNQKDTLRIGIAQVGDKSAEPTTIYTWLQEHGRLIQPR